MYRLFPNTHKAICSDYRLGKATAYAVTVSQKLIVVKSITTGELSHYVMSLIPDKEFAVKHKGNISNIFLNANDRGSFSGIVLYTHNGCPVTVNKYVDGVYTEGTTICGIEDDVKRVTNLKKIVKYISTIRFKRCIAIHSRTGEDNGILDEEDWEYGDEDEYMYITGGIYADEDGNLFIDLDGDGKIDGVYIPPVDVSLEDPGSGDGDGSGGDEPPTGEKDPPGDNGEGEYGEDNTGDGNGDDNTDTNRTNTETILSATRKSVLIITNKYGNKLAYCNQGVRIAFQNIYNKSLPDVNANSLIQYFRNNPENWQKIAMSTAQSYANQGYFTVAGWYNNNGSGHVVVIVPGAETKGYWNNTYTDLPNAMDTGYNMRTESQRISLSFGKDKHQDVEFYIYK